MISNRMPLLLRASDLLEELKRQPLAPERRAQLISDLIEVTKRRRPVPGLRPR